MLVNPFSTGCVSADLSRSHFTGHDLIRREDPAIGSIVTEGQTSPVSLGAVKGIGRRTKLLPGSTLVTAPVQLSSPQTLIQMQGQAGPGQFEILARGSSTSPELIGLAKRGDNGRVVPVMVVSLARSFLWVVHANGHWLRVRR